ncbi:hypothetical protein SK128_007327 [Halocaridina rubra]|uniref:Innexin n=1 Tax=Halocaridina rubra TaxID=373956 RepID=A0AAN8X7C7_HALRR
MAFRALSKVKLKVEVKPVVDSFAFRLHYKYTLLIFLVSAFLATAYDLVGKKIDCMTPFDDPEEECHCEEDSFKEAVDAYCYIMGTFTVDRHHGGKIGVDVPHPGVGPYYGTEAVTYHGYYQWVPIVLFFQGMLFYLPHLLWKVFEGGSFRTIIQNLSIRDYLGSGDNIKNYFTRETQFDELMKYISNHGISHHAWALAFFFFETLNLVVALGMIFFTDWMLGGEFLFYGANVMEVIGMDPLNRTDPMAYVFPKMGKCTFKYFGSSGTIQVTDNMCLIATNVVNEKIYLFLWVWLLLVASVSALWLIMRILMVAIPYLRQSFLKMYVKKEFHRDVATIMETASLSDWFLLVNLGRNMDRMVFSEFIEHFAKESYPEANEIEMDDVGIGRPLSRT